MDSNSYSFGDFVKSIEEMSFLDAYAATMQEFRSLESYANREKRRRSVQQNYSLIKYADNLHAFLFWFNSGIKPATLSEHDFQLAKPLCEKLVAKGELKESALHAFD